MDGSGRWFVGWSRWVAGEEDQRSLVSSRVVDETEIKESVMPIILGCTSVFIVEIVSHAFWMLRVMSSCKVVSCRGQENNAKKTQNYPELAPL